MVQRQLLFPILLESSGFGRPFMVFLVKCKDVSYVTRKITKKNVKNTINGFGMELEGVCVI